MTVAKIRGHITTDLIDSAIQRFLDDIDAMIDNEYGALATQVDTFEGDIFATALFLSRKAVTITTVTEEVKSGVGYTETVLSANDYKLRYGNGQIERLASGDNPRATWGDVVTIVYAPFDETAQRERVTIDLVRLAIEYNALGSESIGDYKSTSVDYEKERGKILSRLKRFNFA